MTRFGPAILALALVSLAAGCPAPRTRPPAGIPAGPEVDLPGCLAATGMPPEDYVVSKFRDHDIVFLGEHHFVKQDVEFVQSLIPLLYENGITDLGIEFGCFEFQAEADALVTAGTYDEDLARSLMFRWASYWPYVEYQDLYRKAWELNRTLPPGAPKFRIVGLDYRARWDMLQERMRPALWRRVFPEGPRDLHMADVVTREFVRKGRKALVYAGFRHAFTRFHGPEFDVRRGQFLWRNDDAMGNRVYDRIGARAMTVLLHFPWQVVRGRRTYDYPLDGAIDRAAGTCPGGRVGFDVAGSPLAGFGDPDSEFAVFRKRFVFGELCDGYVRLGPLEEYEGCSVDPLFVTEENLEEAIAYLPNVRIKRKIFTPAQFLAKFKWDADFRRRYPDLRRP